MGSTLLSLADDRYSHHRIHLLVVHDESVENDRSL